MSAARVIRPAAAFLIAQRPPSGLQTRSPPTPDTLALLPLTARNGDDDPVEYRSVRDRTVPKDQWLNGRVLGVTGGLA